MRPALGPTTGPAGAAAAPGAAPPTGVVEVVVSETTTGLRLFSGPLPISDDAEADARSVADVIGSAADKYRQRVHVICAVPPFVSRDLGYRFDHLKGAYAKVVEQALLRRPGVLVVELAEARAISRTWSRWSRAASQAGSGARACAPAGGCGRRSTVGVGRTRG